MTEGGQTAAGGDGVSKQELGVGEGKKKAWILLLWVPHSRGWFGGRGRGRAAHTHGHSLQYIPLMGGVCACVCVYVSTLTHTPARLRTRPRAGSPRSRAISPLGIHTTVLSLTVPE